MAQENGARSQFGLLVLLMKNNALTIVLLVYALTSLIHFSHNAEYLTDYPNLPESWTRAGVYWAWVGMTAVGLAGWMLIWRGQRRWGMPLLVIYAFLGLDSLGHYVVAPVSQHSLVMNATILAEVSAATLVLIVIVWQVAVGRSSLTRHP